MRRPQPRKSASSPWKGWFHHTGHCFGSWLRGDPRGWRTRHHREHVEGDYKNPPEEGAWEWLFAYSKRLMKRKEVTLDWTLRVFVLHCVVAKLLADGVEVLCASLDNRHLHVLARYPKASPRYALGYAKKYATQKLKAHGLAVGLDLQLGEGIWAKRSHPEPIADQDHHVFAFKYILKHAKKGAVVWHFKMPRPVYEPC